jgi:beta-glucanase (GH16 family)
MLRPLIATAVVLPSLCSAQTPLFIEGFLPAWSGPAPTSPDGRFRVNGPWIGTGGNLIDDALATFIPSFETYSPHGFLQLSVAAARPGQTPYHGSEIQSLATGSNGYGYGYYETRMQVTGVPGVCASFFWIEAPHYGPHEWDIEFLTNESRNNELHLTIHPSNRSVAVPLSFDPSAALHKYGFLWTRGRLQYTIDRQIVYTFNDPSLDQSTWSPQPANSGFLMANTWTGNPNWGGGPPSRTATTTYKYLAFWPNIASVPPLHVSGIKSSDIAWDIAPGAGK